MLFATSSKPLHFIRIRKIDSKEIAEINSWASENLNNQLIMIRGTGYFECFSKPTEHDNIFGLPMPLAKTSDSYEMIIGFVDEVDLTSFLLRFQND